MRLIHLLLGLLANLVQLFAVTTLAVVVTAIWFVLHPPSQAAGRAAYSSIRTRSGFGPRTRSSVS